MPKYIDSHAHMNFHVYDDDRDEVIKRALDNDVWMINVGTQTHTSRGAVELTDQYEEGVYAIVGLHPIHTDVSHHDEQELGEGGKNFTSQGEVFDKKYYEELLKKDNVVGIGECGLDYFRTTPESLDKQRDAFTAQVELAIGSGVPLMIHTRPEKNSMQAYRDTLDILESYNKEHGEKLRGDFHFFAGNEKIAKRILDLGFTCSFTGVVTFTHDYDKVIQYLPSDMILAETDCPYVTPEPYRKNRNEPLYVQEVVKSIANIRDEDQESVRKRLVNNTMRLFNLA